MKALLQTTIGRLRIIAFLEGLSFLILLFIAMPLKYFWGIPEMIRPVGMAHGILFILYLLYVLQVSMEYKWDIKKISLSILASVIPFGTFYADAKLFRD